MLVLCHWRNQVVTTVLRLDQTSFLKCTKSCRSPLTLKFRNDCNFPAFSDLESSVPYNQPNFDVIGNVATSRCRVFLIGSNFAEIKLAINSVYTLTCTLTCMVTYVKVCCDFI